MPRCVMQRLQMKKANVARRVMNNLPCVSSELSRLIGYKTDTTARIRMALSEKNLLRVVWVKSANLRVSSVRAYTRNYLYDFYGQILYILIK